MVNKEDWDKVENEWKEDVEWALTEKIGSQLMRKLLVDILAKRWDVEKKVVRKRIEVFGFDWYKIKGDNKIRCNNPLYYRRVTKTHMGKV